MSVEKIVTEGMSKLFENMRSSLNEEIDNKRITLEELSVREPSSPRQIEIRGMVAGLTLAENVINEYIDALERGLEKLPIGADVDEQIVESSTEGD